MNEERCVECQIESLAYGGDGIARMDGCVLFVPETAVGDRVRVRIIQRKKRFARGVVDAILVPSSDRDTPCCRRAGVRVPGCVYDHLSYAAEVRAKQSQLRGFFRALPDVDTRLAPFFAAPEFLHYRNKLTVHVAHGKMGYYLEQSHTVLDVEACPLSCEAINAALRIFRREHALARYEGANVVFRATPHNGAIWWSDTGAQSVGCPDVLLETSPAGLMRVSPKGFYQVHPAVAQQLVACVAQRFCCSTVSHDIVDLYCGVGVFGLTCLQRGGRSLVGVEAGFDAVRCARENAAALGLAATFHACALTEDAAPGVTLAQLCRVPAETTVIVDPPRSGMARTIAFSLAHSGVARIFYVSCDPATLQRDVQILQAEGHYRVTFIRGFDMFPRTAHFETLVELVRQ
jgi:23S rRNA (uracil1939-C5)-methyltransferase